MACPEFNQRVAVDLPNGTTLYGLNRGCVFGDPTSAHEHYVEVTKAVWADATIVPCFPSRATKHWGVRPLNAAEIYREQRERDFALSLVD
jgi:hypothetical protein